MKSHKEITKKLDFAKTLKIVDLGNIMMTDINFGAKNQVFVVLEKF